MKKAIVLGGTVPHIELIRQLKVRGYHVILIDYYDNPPAKTAADEHIKDSTLDKDIVLELARINHADIVISSCIDQANSTACYVSEILGLPHPYSYQTSLEVTRKGMMKSVFKVGGVPTCEFYILDENSPRDIRLNYPFVIKPTDANSSKGVFRIDTKDNFDEKIEMSFSFSRERKVIVEEFVEGTEIQVDCIAVDGNAYVLMTSDKEAMSINNMELQVAGFSIPGKLCEIHKQELTLIAQKIVDAFHLRNTPFFFQAICNDHGIWVLEFAPRIAGGTRYETVRICSGYDYIDSSIRSFLGESLSRKFRFKGSKYVVRHLYMKPGVFDHIEGLDKLISSGVITHYFPFVSKGREIGDSMNSGNRVGAIMIESTTYESAESQMVSALSELHIIDADGTDKSYWRN